MRCGEESRSGKLLDGAFDIILSLYKHPKWTKMKAIGVQSACPW